MHTIYTFLQQRYLRSHLLKETKTTGGRLSVPSTTTWYAHTHAKVEKLILNTKGKKRLMVGSRYGKVDLVVLFPLLVERIEKKVDLVQPKISITKIDANEKLILF